MTSYYILDTETAGLAPPKTGGSGVVEIAYMEIDPTTLEDLGSYHTRVNPECNIDPKAQAVHGISYEDISHCWPLTTLFEGEDVVIIGHNTSFDLRFVSKYIENLTGSLCTLALARQYVKDAPNHKLGTLAQHLELNSGSAHNAMGDVRTTHSLLKHLVEKSGRTLDSLISAAKKPKLVHTMPFGKHKGVAIVDLPKSYVKWFLEQDIDKDLRTSLEMSLKVAV